MSRSRRRKAIPAWVYAALERVGLWSSGPLALLEAQMGDEFDAGLSARIDAEVTKKDLTRESGRGIGRVGGW
jgi:hypothetical protein